MADRFELDLNVFWKQCAYYKDWDYHFSIKEDARHKYNPKAKEGYPDELLLRGAAHEATAIKAGLRDTYSLRRKHEQVPGSVLPECWADLHQKTDPFKRRYINCCMFVEAAILGTAYEMPWIKALRWPLFLHRTSMMAFTTFPTEAYIQAGLADEVGPPASVARLEPGAIYACQTKGHTFFIIDHDHATDLFLLLEANHRSEYAKPFGGGGWFGGVGYRGIGPVEDRPPADWLERLQARRTFDDTWTDFRSNIKHMCKVHVRAGSRAPAVKLPFDPPEARSPWPRYYFLSEVQNKGGGYFPLGLQQNLHGGVHLPYDKVALDADHDGTVSDDEASSAGGRGQEGPLPIHALGAGELVAARLGPPDSGKDSSNARSLEFMCNYNGFVLLRHRVKVAGEAAPFIIYSLYMHLMPPAVDPTLYANVPWRERLTRQRLGSVVEVDPASMGFGKRRWLTRAEPAGVVEGQATFKVFPEGPGSEGVALELASRAGRAAAMRFAGDSDVEEALAALDDDGQVATFATPFLTVEQGELVGYVAPIPAESRADDDAGFLHWEVMAPVVGSSSDLQRFLTAAERELGLGAGYFQPVEEKSPNNVLDPGSGELRSLLAALPEGDGPGVGGREKLLRDEYTPDDLQGLMRERASELAFALPLEGGARSPGIDYPLRVEVENFQYLGQPTLPVGTAVELQVETDAGTAAPLTLELTDGIAKGTLHVPGGARILRLKQPANAHVAQRDPGEPARELEVEHFRRLTSTRWRRLLLRHGNEWSVEGLLTSLGARLTDKSPAELRPIAEAIAWYNHAENPIVGAEGSEPKLFAAGADRLPADPLTKLDNVNPVTFAWVLDQLITRGKAQLLTQTGGGEGRQPRCLGWAPVEPGPRVAGGELSAVAIARGPASGGAALRLRARSGTRVITLGTPTWSNGFAAVAVTAPLWGAWTLEAEVDGAAPTTPPEPLGGLTVEFPHPTLEDGSTKVTVPPPEASRGGTYTWQVTFDSARPERLRGWVFLETQRNESDVPDLGAEWKCPPMGVPITLGPLTGSGLTEEGGYYTGGKAGVAVSRDFTYGKFCAAARAKTCTVAVRLVVAVQRLRAEAQVNLHLSELRPDGLSVLVGGAPMATLEAAKAGLPTWCAANVEAKGLRLVVERPGDPPGGALSGEFAPQEALGKALAAAKLSPTERLHVRFGLLFVNGAGPSGDAVGRVDWGRLVDDAGGDRLRVGASRFSRTLVQPAFGPVKATLNRKGELSLSAPLWGADAAFWRDAKPGFTLNGERLVTSRPNKQHNMVDATVSLEAHVGEALALRAACQTTGTIDGVEVAVTEGATLDYTVTPAVLEASALEEPERARVRITANLRAWPPGKDVEVVLLDASGASVALRAGDVRFDIRGSKGRGTCDGDGTFGARIDIGTLLARLNVTSGEARYAIQLRAPGAVLGDATPEPWSSETSTHALPGGEP